MNGIELIAAERARQIEQEGWTVEHDDEHYDNELARAAGCYVAQYVERSWLLDMPNGVEKYQDEETPDDWPWDYQWWKPKDPVRDLVRAGALIAAEIDRLQRAGKA